MMKKTFVALATFLLILSCSSDDSGNGSSDNFDRGALLSNWADNIIVPAYQNFANTMSILEQAATTFTTTPDQNNLDNLRSKWLEAYKAWQYVEMFNIGKAEEITYSFYMNVYPLNASDVENNITNGSYDLTAVNNQDAQGFPAIDYLINGVAATDAEIINKYTTDTNATAYKAYLNDVVARMESLTTTVLNDWNNGYRDAFVANSGNTVTSAVNKLVNDFIFYYEKGLRANKIGIPAGVFSTTPLPDKVEAYYKSDVSKVLATEALQAVKDFFNGKHFNSTATGESLVTYLDYLNTIKDGSDLSLLINNQYNTASTKLAQLDNNFTSQINTNNTKMTETFDELQRAVVLMKVDMLQALNISVDFVDADGD